LDSQVQLNNKTKVRRRQGRPRKDSKSRVKKA